MSGSPAKRLDILLCAPRGFCAGVDRAIQIVELALQRFGAPGLCPPRDRPQPLCGREPQGEGRGLRRGARRDPGPDQPVIFSAHGVPKAVPASARGRGTSSISTPPARWSPRSTARPSSTIASGREIVLIGHAGHPEVVGTMGQLPPGAVTLVETAGGCARLPAARPGQPRLRHPDHAVGRRHRRDRRGAQAPLSRASSAPHKEDICYATTNRQEAVKRVAPRSTR